MAVRRVIVSSVIFLCFCLLILRSDARIFGESFTWLFVPRDCIIESCGGIIFRESVEMDSYRVLLLVDGKMCSTQFARGLLCFGSREEIQMYGHCLVWTQKFRTYVFESWHGLVSQNLQDLVRLDRGCEIIIRLRDGKAIYTKTLNDRQRLLFSFRKSKYLIAVKKFKRLKLSVPYYPNSVPTNRIIILQDGDVEVNPGPNRWNSVGENRHCLRKRPTNNNIQSIVTYALREAFPKK